MLILLIPLTSLTCFSLVYLACRVQIACLAYIVYIACLVYVVYIAYHAYIVCSVYLVDLVCPAYLVFDRIAYLGCLACCFEFRCVVILSIILYCLLRVCCLFGLHC